MFICCWKFVSWWWWMMATYDLWLMVWKPTAKCVNHHGFVFDMCKHNCKNWLIDSNELITIRAIVTYCNYIAIPKIQSVSSECRWISEFIGRWLAILSNNHSDISHRKSQICLSNLGSPSILLAWSPGWRVSEWWRIPQPPLATSWGEERNDAYYAANCMSLSAEGNKCAVGVGFMWESRCNSCESALGRPNK